MKASLISHVRRNRKALLAVSAATLTAMPFLSSVGFGVVYKTWTGAISSDFEIAGNWSPSGVPSVTTSSSGAIVVFTGTPTANQPTLSKDRALYGILFDSAGWTLGGSFTLSVGGAGILGSANVSGSNILDVNTVIRTSAIASGYSGSTLTVNSSLAGPTNNYPYGRAATPGPEYGGTVVLTGQSTSAGSPNILDSTLSASSLNSVFTDPTLGTVHSATSNLGCPLTYGNGQITFRSSDKVNVTEPTLLYTGAGEITDRSLYMSTAIATGGDNRVHTIQNDGTGPLVLVTQTYAAAANSIWQFSGSNTDPNRMAGMVSDTTVVGVGTYATTQLPISVRKGGTGFWSLSGTNTYSGTTEVNGGTLALGSAHALGASPSATTVNADGILDLAGNSPVAGKAITLNGGALINSTGSATLGTGASAAMLLGSGTWTVQSTDPVPTVSISDGGGSGATGAVSMWLNGFGISNGGGAANGGTDYTYADVTFSAPDLPGGVQAVATATVSGGAVTALTLTSRGSGYSTMPTMTISGDGSGAVSTYNMAVRGIVLTDGGVGYTSAPTVTVDAGTVGTYTTTSGFASVSLTADSSIGGAGSLTVSSPISGSFGLTKIGAGVTTLAGNNSYNGTTTLKAGRLVLASDGTNSAWTPVLSNPGGADVQAGRLVFDYTGSATTPADTVKSILTAGYGQATKFSSGAIRTSNTPDTAKGLGWMDDAANHQVIVAYTYFGDANLDGQVDISDLGALATSWQTSAVWSQGDFDYSGFVDISDLGMLATNWQLGVGAPLGPSFDEALASVGLAGVSVPEPTSMALLGLCLAGVSTRRHRREAAAAQ